MTHSTDGNIYAINLNLEALEDYYDTRHCDDMYCAACDEVIGEPSILELCPHCGTELVELDT
jgi:hypothetical protein